MLEKFEHYVIARPCRGWQTIVDGGEALVSGFRGLEQPVVKPVDNHGKLSRGQLHDLPVAFETDAREGQ